MGRPRGFATMLALIGLLAALLAPAAGAAEPLYFGRFIDSPSERLASESLLRLTDMPAGFVHSGESFCGRPSEASEYEGIYERQENRPPNPSEAFLERNGIGFCVLEYERLYRAPGTGSTPIELVSFALATPSAAAAGEGLALGPEPFEYTLGVGGFSAGAAPALGEEARLFTTNRSRFRRLSNLPGTLVLWRQGATIGGVLAVATKATVSDAAGTAYAIREQSYLAAPRPFLTAEADDLSTYLSNPHLRVPLYWLGASFKPKGLSSSYFEGAYGSEELALRIPGRELSVDYSDGPILDTWTPAGWAKFAKTALGRRQWSWHCTRSQAIDLPHGHAVLYAAYKKDFKTCPSGHPEHFSAHVFLPGAVIAIGEATTPNSQGDLYGYESRRGLKAIVRNLRRYQP